VSFSQVMSFGLAPFSIAGVVVAVRGRRRGPWGWVLAAATQVAWIAYAVFVGPWPLGIGSVAWAVVYVWAFVKERREAGLGVVAVKLSPREVQMVLDGLDDLRMRHAGDDGFAVAVFELAVRLRGDSLV
jgi:hypothetical protein